MRCRALVLTAIIATVYGCSSIRPVSYTFMAEEMPAIGETATARVGEPVLRKGEVAKIPALLLKKEARDKIAMIRLILPAGTYPAVAENKKYIFYMSNRFTYEAPLGYARLAGIAIPKAGGEPKMAIRNQMGTYEALGRSAEPMVFEKVEITDPAAGTSYLQELLYDGRIGDTIRFTYREFAGNIERPSFVQQVQFDISDGRRIRFRSAEFEVISADNTEITYRVLSRFKGLR